MSDYQFYTRATHPELSRRTAHLGGLWPAFIYYDSHSPPYYRTMENAYAQLHFYLCEKEHIIAQGQAMGLQWNGTHDDLPDGWTDAVKRSAIEVDANQEPDTLCAVSAAIAKTHHGRGLGTQIVHLMRQLAARYGYQRMLAPVRPSQKQHYPLIPMENYIQWQRADGYRFDSWLRSHERAGGSVLQVAPRSMQVEGSVEEWEAWTGMTFPRSGRYIVDGALHPVHIDLAADTGTYIEANVWMQHRVP